MNAKAYVIECNDGNAKVKVIRRTACDSCASCSQKEACHAELFLSDTNKTYVITAKNDMGAKPGDMVEIESENKKQLALAFALFLFPVIFGIIAYIIFSALKFEEYSVLFAVLVSVGAFFACAYAADNYSKKNMQSYIVKIIEESGESPQNEDAR